MKDENGTSLWYETKAGAADCALKITEQLKSTPAYKELSLRVKNPRLPVYFQYIIQSEIYPFVRQAYMIRWHKRNNKTIPHKESMVLLPKIGLFGELKKCWDFEDVPAELVNPISLRALNNVLCKEVLLKLIKSLIKGPVISLTEIFYGIRKRNLPARTDKPCIACQYNEGINFSKRNDLNWYPGSGINPEKILIYFDMLDTITCAVVKKEIIQQIEEQRFKWVAIRKNVVEGQQSVWRPPKLCADPLIKKSAGENKLEEWLIKRGNELLKRIHYWRSFYDDFNIKIHYMPAEYDTENIVQAIAFDINKKGTGALVGKHRSEFILPTRSCIGSSPKHVFFIWSRNVEFAVKPNYDFKDVLVISGYPNDIFTKHENFCLIPRSNGAKFVIAFFDDGGSDFSHFGKEDVAKFYNAFLQWVLDDPEVGLTIKSKKPFIISESHTIHALLDSAIATGRCVRVPDEFGRFPSDASYGADMAVGCGISTAATEAVIGGCRGIHYNNANLKNHRYYRWGFEHLIFNNLERLLAALKQYKRDPKEKRLLGDWSLHMDELDPFRDGKGGEREGVYMRWLLEAFDKGKSRDEAIKYANSRYGAQWGTDKIIDMKSRLRWEKQDDQNENNILDTF
jgi:hypothetical protein